jgi:hypothetical protein
MKSTSVPSKQTLTEQAARPNVGVGRIRRLAVEDPLPLPLPLPVPALEGKLALSLSLSLSSLCVLPPSLGETDLALSTRTLVFGLHPDKHRHKAQDVKSPAPAWGHVERTVSVYLPEALAVAYWTRHEFSSSDVQRTVEGFSPQLLWRATMYYHGPEIPRTPITKIVARACSDLDFGIAFETASKTNAISQLMKCLAYQIQDWKTWTARTSVTWNMTKDGEPNGDGRKYSPLEALVPVVPVHRISSERLFDMVRCELGHLRSASDNAAAAASRKRLVHPVPESALQTARFAPCVYSWRGIWFVVMETWPSVESVRVVRVVPWDEFCGRVKNASKQVLAGMYTFVDSAWGPLVCLSETIIFHATATANATATSPLTFPLSPLNPATSSSSSSSSSSSFPATGSFSPVMPFDPPSRSACDPPPSRSFPDMPSRSSAAFDPPSRSWKE